MVIPTPIADLLAQPFPWRSWTYDATVGAVLHDLQANILKGHGRQHTRHLFWDFTGAAPNELRATLRKLGNAMPSALRQLTDTEFFKATGQSGGPVLCFFLRPGCYTALGMAGGAPADAAYQQGLAARGAGINDPAVGRWQAQFQQHIDAMLLIAGDSVAQVDGLAAAWSAEFKNAGCVLGADETGLVIRRQVNGKPEGVEHFGYVDGRSQPLFLAEDVAAEPSAFWDPAFPPGQVLVRDPGGATPGSFGSFFVFRKLEQNVQGFKNMEEDLAKDPGLGLFDTPFESRAGAMVIGRHWDGTPLVESPIRTDMAPGNDFDYRHDRDGVLCPFRSHIRKTNPRGESPAHTGTFLRVERSHIMARRGITFGNRNYNPPTNDFVDRPLNGVGLLFMAYMADIANQFEFTQASWANNPNFVEPGVGVDHVIGQGAAAPATPWDDGWAAKVSAAPFDFTGLVTMLGGEYFFAPSLSFLKSL